MELRSAGSGLPKKARGQKAALIAICTAVLTLSPAPARAEALTCHDLVQSYIEADNAPVLMDTTAYIEGEICYTGCRVREGIAAVAEPWVGMAAVVYEAIPDGSEYRMGDFLGIYECLDTGYGKSTGDGIRSKVRPDKKSRGTIEQGLCIDIYRESMAGARDWMEMTGGKVFCQLIPAEG